MRLNILFRVGLIGTVAFVYLALFSIPGETRDSRVCGKDVELRLSSSESSQGSLLLVEVHSTSPLAELKAQWDGHTLLFWRENSQENVQRALLGVDLERPAGQYPLTVAAQLENRERVTCSAVVSVKAGRFAIERLRVRRQFVDLSPKNLERTARERQRLGELFARVTPERLWQGAFRVPVDGAQAAGNFGRRRVLNGRPGMPHNGEDFPAVAGAPVHAAQRGRVVLADELFFSGNTVVLDHGLGLYTFYGHLESIAVTVGEVVEVGTTLGRVGATGRATGAHLHWSVRANEARIKPLGIVRLPAD